MELDFDPNKNISALDHLLIPFKDLDNKIKNFVIVSCIVKNWDNIVVFRLGVKKNRFVMKLRNGKNIEINKPEDYFSFWESGESQKELIKRFYLRLSEIAFSKNKIIKLKFSNKKLKFYYDGEEQLGNTLRLIKEQFIEQQYSWLEVKNKVVIDIGANVGDSAIYFALKGAKHVYAFEPYPYSYGIATQNVRLNGLEGRITLLNEGCGKEKRKIKIDVSYKNFGGTDLKNFENGTNINITTLGELVKRFDISSEAVLKIDCEGCEYGVLLNTENSNLRKFKQIQIEYHYGYLNLKKKLEDAGFNVSRKLPNFIFNLEAENSEMLIGLLYANRV